MTKGERYKLLRNIFLINLLLFCISFLTGFFLPYGGEAFMFFFKDILILIKDLPWLGIVAVIVLHNLRSVIVMFISGFAFLSVPILVFNGYVSGVVTNLSGLSLSGALLLLLPHGVFEIPAIALSASLGTLLSLELLKKNRDLAGVMKYSMRVTLKVILPLVIIAGIIEGITIAGRGV